MIKPKFTSGIINELTGKKYTHKYPWVRRKLKVTHLKVQGLTHPEIKNEEGGLDRFPKSGPKYILFHTRFRSLPCLAGCTSWVYL